MVDLFTIMMRGVSSVHYRPDYEARDWFRTFNLIIRFLPMLASTGCLIPLV